MLTLISYLSIENLILHSIINYLIPHTAISTAGSVRRQRQASFSGAEAVRTVLGFNQHCLHVPDAEDVCLSCNNTVNTGSISAWGLYFSFLLLIE